MIKLFETVLQMSCYGTAAALVVYLVTVLLGRSRVSKTALLLLWLVVGFRLVCPWSPSSPASLFNWWNMDSLIGQMGSSGQDIYVDRDKPATQYGWRGTDTATLAVGVTPVQNSQGQWKALYGDDGKTVKTTFRETYGSTLAAIWVVGVMVSLGCGVMSYFRLRQKLRFAVRDETLHDVWRSDAIPSPCVVGLLPPKIYLTFDTSNEDAEYVLAHERQHIQNRDPLWSVLAWLILCIHWFNPCLWAAYRAFLWSLEQACDQRVLQEMGADRRADYGQSLLNLSAGKRLRLSFSPLAFKEGNIKSRLKAILRYQKPWTWLTVIAVALSAAVGVSVATSRAETEGEQSDPETIPGSSQTIYGTYDISDVIHLSPLSSSTTDYELQRQKDNQILFTPERFTFRGLGIDLIAPVYEPIETWDRLLTTQMGDSSFQEMFALDLTQYDNVQGWKVRRRQDGKDMNCHIFWIDGKLWVGDWLVHNNARIPYGEYWIIWEGSKVDVPETEHRTEPDSVVYWEYAPTMSSKFPAFPISFSFSSACSRVEFRCEKGSLLIWEDGVIQAEGRELAMEYQPSGRVCWSPLADNMICSEDMISFTLYQDEAQYTGRGDILIQREDVPRDGDEYTVGMSKYTARASLSDESYFYFVQNTDPMIGGALLGGGLDYWPPFTFVAHVTAVDTGADMLTVQPEQTLADGVDRFQFPCPELGEYSVGTRVLITARRIMVGGPELATFGQVDEVIPLSNPLAEWAVDLTRSGTDERVYITRQGEELFHLIVENAAKKVLWHGEAGTVHAGQNGFYLYEESGRFYLLNWSNYMATGMGSYFFRLFTLSESGTEQRVLQDSVTIDYGNMTETDPALLRAFDAQINDLLSRSVVLLSTNGDTPDGIWYGNPDSPVLPLTTWDSGTACFAER